MIGDVGVHFLGPENLDFELGFTINPKHQKKGFAREAAVGIVDHLFTNNFKRRAIAVVEPTNNSSIVLVEKKLQMKLRIVAKENANVEEDRVEDLVFEIQREEWIKLKEEGKIGEPSLRT
jgi:RimJ/RimL family protein N-acetyltransferase